MTDADHDPDYECEDCEENRAERAWERQCSRYYGGDGPLPLTEQLRRAQELKR